MGNIIKVIGEALSIASTYIKKRGLKNKRESIDAKLIKDIVEALGDDNIYELNRLMRVVLDEKTVTVRKPYSKPDQ